MTPNERQRAAHRLSTSETRRVNPAVAPKGTLIFEPGQEIPGARLLVLRKLGEGGFGVVYECQDLDLQVPVAVKLLTTNAKTAPELVAVFQEETRALAKLDSDHIVRVRRFGVTNEVAPRPFLVMFKLEGTTLLDALSTLGRFTERDAILYGIHIAMGLATAHAAGLVHRDIKPANIFLATKKDPITSELVAYAVILDFGIAKAASSGAPDSKKLPVICSAPYCGPEQYHGRAFPQTDLYALAVTLFIMLTLEHPLGYFASDREWVRAKLVDQPRPQRVNHVIDELNLTRGAHKQKIARVDAELEDLLDRTLSYDPADRPGTAEAFVRSLEVIQERLRAADEAKAGKRAPRGARTVPETAEQIQKRITAEYARSNRPVPQEEPETVQSLREVEERLERSKVLEELVLGLSVDHPQLTEADVAAIRAQENMPRRVTLANGLSQQLAIAGSTLESPQAAQRNALKWSTAGARVTLAPDRTPVVAGAPELPALPPPAEPDVPRRGFTAANGSVISLPMSGLWMAKVLALGWVDRNLFRPRQGRHWIAALVWLAVAFFVGSVLVTATVILVRSLVPERWARPVPVAPTASVPSSSESAPSSAALPVASSAGAVPAVAPPVGSAASEAPSSPPSAASSSSATVSPALHGAPSRPKTGPAPARGATKGHIPAAPLPKASAARPSPELPPFEMSRTID